MVSKELYYNPLCPFVKTLRVPLWLNFLPRSRTKNGVTYNIVNQIKKLRNDKENNKEDLCFFF